jgi:hypothetical protein
VTTDEERAKILRAIALGGFSPYSEDSDGSTANTLLEWAEELAPVFDALPLRKRVRAKVALLNLWRGLTGSVKRQRRAADRRLWLIPVAAIAWATVEVRALVAQTPPDSLYQLPTVRAALGTWSPTRIWCVTRAADYGTLLVLVSVTPADSTRCTRPDGTRAPLFIDAEECPPATFDPGQFPWVVVRCGADDYRKFQRRQPERRTQ